MNIRENAIFLFRNFPGEHFKFFHSKPVICKTLDFIGMYYILNRKSQYCHNQNMNLN